MPKNIAAVHVKNSRGKVSVLGMGQTPRGQKYIREIIDLEVKKIDDPKFKEELATAVEQLMS